ncbi:hypothetical protein [Succinimonas sp.]|uniref:hypothetical protein n=1 Tax=Succinimonas sp. TaxID=1936151 RepID=UPI003863F2C3
MRLQLISDIPIQHYQLFIYLPESLILRCFDAVFDTRYELLHLPVFRCFHPVILILSFNFADTVCKIEFT